jgi:uncharacterized protein
MLYNVSSLLKAPIGAQMTLDIQEGPHRLSEDLAVGYLRGTVRVIRTDHRLLVQSQINTEVPAECVRCLDLFQLKLKVRFEELFTFFPDSPADKTYHIDENGFLHLDKALSEQVQLAMPIQTLCRPDCRGLCSQCGQNWNEGTCDCTQADDDPRLSTLRALLE